MFILLVTVVIVIFAVLAAYYDIRFNKIYNWLNLSFVLVGLGVNIYIGGIYGLCMSLLGLTAGIGILLLPYLMGWVGGGDVKFLAAAGSIIGPSAIVYAALYGLITFGIVALIYLILKKRLAIFLKQVVFWLYTKVNAIEVTTKLPLGPFLALGVIIQWLYSHFL